MKEQKQETSIKLQEITKEQSILQLSKIKCEI